MADNNVPPTESPKEQANPVDPVAKEDLTQLTPAIVEALGFNSSAASEKELRVQNAKLQALLGKVIELWKDRSSLCVNLERQNNALMLQTNSLKDVVAITKDLLSIRNMEVEHLHVDIKSMETKINDERTRHTAMLNRMNDAIKLNDNLKAEYTKQLGLFTDLKARYEEKVALLEGENRRLKGLGGDGEGQGEGVILDLLPAADPPTDASNSLV